MGDNFPDFAIPSSSVASVENDLEAEGEGGFGNETLAEINLDLNPEAVEIALPEASEHCYTFKDITIKFPYVAYESQIQMMEKVIQGVTAGENCLLESPTGTGKTAALLCSLLAWQKDCYEKRDYCGNIIDAAAERLGGCSCGLIINETTSVMIVFNNWKYHLRATTSIPSTPPQSNSTLQPHSTSTPTKITQPLSGLSLASPISAKNVPPPSAPGTSTNLEDPLPSTSTAQSPFKKQKIDEDCPTTASVKTEERLATSVCAYCRRKYLIDKSRPPKIYYATRTHSQIAQVVKQLKMTAYKEAKMSILASREPLCINTNLIDKVKREQVEDPEHPVTTDDICRHLRSNYFKNKKLERDHPDKYEALVKDKQVPPVCDYFRPPHQMKNDLEDFQNQGAFDIEDVKSHGQTCGLCPYYGCTAMHQGADIVFCSYNYLLYPSLRTTTEIQFVNNVIVFDEAHNIEDICRNALSLVFDVQKFDKDVRPLVDNLILKLQNKSAEINYNKARALDDISRMLKDWSSFIKDRGSTIIDPQPRKKQEVRESFEDDKVLEILNRMGMTSEKIGICLRLIEEVNTEPDDGGDHYYLDGKGQRRPFKISYTVNNTLNEILQTLEYLFKEEEGGMGGAKDFKVSITRSQNRAFRGQASSSSLSQGPSNGLQQSSQLSAEPEFHYTLQIICLNPAIGFRILKDSAYSIIVASGTLTPMESFASELCTNFPVTLQANHVIPSGNVWAGVVSRGPTNHELKLTKDEQCREVIQDEIGSIIVQICATVPNGVLVFFPSYSLMRTLQERWEFSPPGNSVLQRIKRTKRVFWENSRSKEEFKRDMEEYMANVRGGDGWNGCVLFAVFRGKISEGIDFADDQARAVVTIGIPFSNAGSFEIQSKRTYNDSRSRPQPGGQQVLSGFDWYKTQAFRAMNQGLGRCVRHSKDWGALILIDSRLQQGHYQNQISRWVRNKVRVFNNFDEMQQMLNQFMTERQSL